MVTKVWKTDDGLFFYNEEEAITHENNVRRLEEFIRSLSIEIFPETTHYATEQYKLFNEGVREALEAAFNLGYLKF